MDLMIDIETLATNPDAVVLTIGAIKFDPFADNRQSVDFENKQIISKNIDNLFGDYILVSQGLLVYQKTPDNTNDNKPNSLNYDATNYPTSDHLPIIGTIINKNVIPTFNVDDSNFKLVFNINNESMIGFVKSKYLVDDKDNKYFFKINKFYPSRFVPIESRQFNNKSSIFKKGTLVCTPHKEFFLKKNFVIFQDYIKKDFYVLSKDDYTHFLNNNIMRLSNKYLKYKIKYLTNSNQ